MAQIKGRSFITWEIIFSYDLEYIKNLSFINDVKIILPTVKKVFIRENIADVSQAVKDQNGVFHFESNGKKIILHQPLNVERKKQCSEKSEVTSG